MRILYGIPGTGNGHITRAIEIIPQLHQQGIVDVLVSGYQSEIPLPFPVKYKIPAQY
jgi:UDP-N-acetylglucosamine:LPS N-acetylglucosamine transferase